MSKNKTPSSQLAAAEKYREKKIWRKQITLVRAENAELIAKIEALPRGEFSGVITRALENYFNEIKE